MSTATVEITNWVGQYDEALAHLRAKADAVATRIHNRLWLTAQLWSIYKELRGLVNRHSTLVSRFAGMEFDTSPLRSAGIVDSTIGLYDSFTRLRTTIRSHREYANSTVIGSALDAIKGASLDLLDLAELLDVSFDDHTRELVESARIAFDSDEIIPLA